MSGGKEEHKYRATEVPCEDCGTHYAVVCDAEHECKFSEPVDTIFDEEADYLLERFWARHEEDSD